VAEAELAALARVVCSGTVVSHSTSDSAAADAFVQCLAALTTKLNIPTRLRDLGVRRDQLPSLVAGSQGNSLTGNPRKIDDAELTSILETMW
jgi:alcohol dehydrogenase class IV